MVIYLNTIYKSKLIFKKKIFFCQLGKNGKVPNYKKKEGDKCTPIGKFIINSIFLRRDKKLNIPFIFVKIMDGVTILTVKNTIN